MARHHGAHPRIGAIDVCPIVPIAGVTMEECVEIARGIGRRIGEELRIPVYFYEHAASSRRAPQPRRRPRRRVRGAGAEAPGSGLGAGCRTGHASTRSGASVVGAREFLIAYNVNLNTRDRKLANEIALNIREDGAPEARRPETWWWTRTASR